MKTFGRYLKYTFIIVCIFLIPFESNASYRMEYSDSKRPIIHYEPIAKEMGFSKPFQELDDLLMNYITWRNQYGEKAPHIPKDQLEMFYHALIKVKNCSKEEYSRYIKRTNEKSKLLLSEQPKSDSKQIIMPAAFIKFYLIDKRIKQEMPWACYFRLKTDYILIAKVDSISKYIDLHEEKLDPPLIGHALGCSVKKDILGSYNYDKKFMTALYLNKIYTNVDSIQYTEKTPVNVEAGKLYLFILINYNESSKILKGYPRKLHQTTFLTDHHCIFEIQGKYILDDTEVFKMGKKVKIKDLVKFFEEVKK